MVTGKFKDEGGDALFEGGLGGLVYGGLRKFVPVFDSPWKK